MNIKWFGTFENYFIFGSIGLGKISISVVGIKSTDGMIAFAWLLTSKQWLIGSQLRNRIMHVRRQPGGLCTTVASFISHSLLGLNHTMLKCNEEIFQT